MPPPKPLDTPTGLESNSVHAAAEALNGVLADSFALYLKSKNFHWHVSGPHFRDYHLMLDEQAAQILATTDAIAERVQKSAGRRCARSATSPGGSGSRTMMRISSARETCWRSCARII